MESRETVEAVPGNGLRGDRYFESQGTFFAGKQRLPDKEVTLIEQEALDALSREYGIELSPAEGRRNLVTSGVALNHLVGREFTVGCVRLRGIRLCEPCDHLERLTGKNLKGLTHRGGLRAQVISAGTIKVGDPIKIGARFSAEFLDYVKAIVGGDCLGGKSN
jgi:MOSC domain-containing protein YiiM